MSKPSFTFVMDKGDVSLQTTSYIRKWGKWRNKGGKMRL